MVHEQVAEAQVFTRSGGLHHRAFVLTNDVVVLDFALVGEKTLSLLQGDGEVAALRIGELYAVAWGESSGICHGEILTAGRYGCFMLDFRPGERLLACTFSFVSGFVDSIGFLYLGGVFLSFMSGNTTRSATALVEGNWSLATLAGSCIILFLAGVVLGAITNRWATRRWDVFRAREAVLFAVALIFLLTSILTAVGLDDIAILTLSVGIGATNSIFERKGEVAIPLTYMTGTLVKMGQRFADTFFGGSHVQWVYHFVLWAALSVGAILGALTFHRLGMHAVIIITGVVIVAALINQIVRNRRRKAGLPL